MRYIADDFIFEATKQSIIFRELSAKELNKYRLQVEEKFCRKGEAAIWERIITDESSIYLPNGKTMIDQLNISSNYILFFEKDVDDSGFLVNSIKELTYVIQELFGFVFYLTNEHSDFLVCWNDHEFLIGTGSVKESIDRLKLKYGLG